MTVFANLLRKGDELLGYDDERIVQGVMDFGSWVSVEFTDGSTQAIPASATCRVVRG